MLKALHGFRAAGMVRAMLEVTARNSAAVRLYHWLGFQIVKTLYREVHAPTEELFII
jgi:ribosomal protein S18 acetylase RimI-like enzyme